jgi:hypothetical protein
MKQLGLLGFLDSTSHQPQAGDSVCKLILLFSFFFHVAQTGSI